MVVKSEDGRELRSFKFKDEDQNQAVRALERRILLETLANKLPPDAIQFSSKFSKIESSENGETLLELTDGTGLLAKVSNSQMDGFLWAKVCRALCFPWTRILSQRAALCTKVNYIDGRGLRAGCVPVSPTKVHWFICHNSSLRGFFFSFLQ